MFLGLRKTAGVTHAEFEKKFGQPMSVRYGKTIERAVADGLLEQDAVGVRLTRKGRFVGNEVFQQFLLED